LYNQKPDKHDNLVSMVKEHKSKKPSLGHSLRYSFTLTSFINRDNTLPDNTDTSLPVGSLKF
jgi:hypothetical protein